MGLIAIKHFQCFRHQNVIGKKTIKLFAVLCVIYASWHLFCFLIKTFDAVHLPRNVDFIDTATSRKYITFSEILPGGIGNQMFRFASIYGIARQIERQPFILGSETEQVAEMPEFSVIFPNVFDIMQIINPHTVLIRNVTFSPGCSEYENPKKLTYIPEKFIKIEGDYLQSYKFFYYHQNDIRRLFECGPIVWKQLIDPKLKYIYAQDKNHKLCAHIRRGDFLEDDQLESRSEFIVPAIDHVLNFLKNKAITNVTLVFFGNDNEYVDKLVASNLSHIPNRKLKMFPQRRGPAMCFAIQQCDTLLMTATGSTFGWWIGYLMRPGSDIFYNNQVGKVDEFEKDTHDFDYLPPQWHSLKLNSNGSISKGRWWYQRNNVSPPVLDEDNSVEWF